ncbi:MAG: M13 family metallopeptidase [Polyangiaceae bacterium]
MRTASRSFPFPPSRLLVPALLVTATVSLGAACAPSNEPPKVPGPTTAEPPKHETVTTQTGASVESSASLVGVDVASLDKSVSPCDDFYQFACGGWQKSTPIPADEAGWYRTFNGIGERNEKMLHDILESYAKGENASDPYAKKLGDFYGSCMDEAGIEKAGVEPLKPVLAAIDGTKDAASLAKTVAMLHKAGIVSLFDYESGSDFKDANTVIGQLSQGGIGMPDRDYYTKDDPRSKELRAKYEEHVAAMLALAGDKQGKAHAKDVVAFETELAKVSMTKVELRDPVKVYHKTTPAELKAMSPAFAWDTYFAEMGTASPPLNVAQPDFMKALGTLVGKGVDWNKLRTYMRFHTVRRLAGALPSRFVDENFKFMRVLTGMEKLPPRWKRCVRATDDALGEALAQSFVKKTLGEGGKATAQTMIRGIEHAMKENLAALRWMDGETKAKANEKLETIVNKIGFPDKWRNYDALVVEKGSYAKNRMKADEFESKRQLAKVGRPVDRGEWQMTPPSVNAYYDPTLNEMVFPAGILQAPYFSKTMTPGMNFGGIGMVMGHELTHGFDDEGRQFDAKGNLTDWWTAKSTAEFSKRTECVEKQYDEYTAVADAKVNGKLTLGENIADVGGLKLAYAAFKKATEGKTGAPVDGFTDDQQFFLGFAQGWCANVRDETMRLMVSTNQHSPPRFRVIGPVSNSSDFAKAFSCKAGSPMVRPNEKRCEVW